MILKDPENAQYEFRDRPQFDDPTSGGGRNTGGGGGEQSRSPEEKKELEKASRQIAIRKLAENGYNVEAMSLNNPGYDLLAKKGNEELRIEVKGHARQASIIDLTWREYEEYRNQREYSWELWNVEHLDMDDDHQIAISRFKEIPEEALRTRTFRVDLKSCR